MDLNTWLCWLLIIVGALHWGAAVYTWRFRRVPGGVPFLSVMFIGGVWAISFGIPLGSENLRMAVWADQVRFMFLAFMGPALLFAVLEHVRQQTIRDMWPWGLLLVIPAITMLLGLTMPWHRLLRYGFRYETAHGMFSVVCHDGLWYRVHMVYTYLLLLAATGVALSSMHGRGLVYRRQAVMLAVAPQLPALLNLAFTAGIWPAPLLNLAPFSLLLSGSLMAVALFHYRMFDLRPLAISAAIQQMQDAFVLVDAQQRVVDLNDAAALMLGFSPAQAIGQPLADLLVTWPEALVLAQQTEDVVQTEMICCPEVPEVAVFYDVRAAVVKTDDGTVMGRVFLFRDITERKRAEVHLARDLARERELHQLKSTFVTLVSHEFRTPLATMQGAADLLSAHFDAADPAIRKRSLRSIRGQIQRLTNLIDQATTLNRLEIGQVPFSPQPADAGTLVRTWCLEAVAAAGRGADLQFDTKSLPARQMCLDAFLAKCIVDNLLENALKYSPTGSPIEVRLQHDGQCLTIAVADRGIGIPEALMPSLYMAFQRGANVGRVKGTGVGLFLVKRCTDLHQGSISVSPRDGGGVCFTVTLPAPPLEQQ